MLEPLRGVTSFDYVIMAAYVVFMLSLGLVFRGLSKTTSDYFRGGGAMPWWITGASAWVVNFSAWTFVGAASEVYKSGLKVMMLFLSCVPAFGIVMAFSAVRFRRLRVVTWTEAVRERFGPRNEQFYTWIKVPIELLKAGIFLMSISVFVAAVLQLHVNSVIAVLGVVITVIAFAGGAFAVLASDFVQMFLITTITLVVMLLAVYRPEIGGFSGLIDKVNVAHPAHFRWWLNLRPAILLGWGLAFLWLKTSELNSLEFSTMYLMSKSETHARRMVVIPLVGMLIGPFIWVTPPLVATVLFPHLPQMFPALTKPTEGAFVAVAMQVLPVGMLGLLMCAMFGSTLTVMDAAVNKYVGVFVRSFYRPILAPAASDAQLMRVSKICTLVFGAIIVVVSLLVNTYRQTDVFTLLNQLMVSVGVPLTVPLFFGLFYRRTPDWSAWVSALVSFGFSAWANFIFAARMQAPDFIATLPSWLVDILGRPGTALNGEERADLLLIVTTFGTAVVGISTFFLSSLAYRKAPVQERQRVDQLFQKLDTPLDRSGGSALSDEPVYRLLGALCLVFGGFVLLLTLIPNPPLGRLMFAFIGLAIGGTGWILHRTARAKRRSSGV